MPKETLTFEHPLSFHSEAYHGLKKPEGEKKEETKIEVEIVPDEAEGTETELPDLRTSEAKEADKEVKEDDDDLPKDLPENTRFGIQKRINKEVWKRHESERARQAAEGERDRLKSEIETLRKRSETSESTALSSREEQIKSAREAAKREYLAAAEAQDITAMFEATQKLAAIAADDKEVEIYKRNKAAAQPQQQQPQGEQQRQEQQRQQPQADPLAVEWAGSNPWFGRDRVMTAAAFAIDQELKEEGIPPATKQFYNELDKRLRDNLPQKFPSAETRKKANAQPVAGASRAPASTGKKVQLTEREADVARRLGVPAEEYARFVVR